MDAVIHDGETIGLDREAGGVKAVPPAELLRLAQEHRLRNLAQRGSDGGPGGREHSKARRKVLMSNLDGPEVVGRTATGVEAAGAWTGGNLQWTSTAAQVAFVCASAAFLWYWHVRSKRLAKRAARPTLPAEVRRLARARQPTLSPKKLKKRHARGNASALAQAGAFSLGPAALGSGGSPR